MHKMEMLVEDKWVAHSFKPIFHIPQNDDSSKRIVAGVPGGDPAVLGSLVECLEPPYYLLYVLHTPRGEAKPGRYQSPPLSLAQVQALLERFGAFFSADARYDLWAHSQSSNATVVWDRHNLLFGYGPLDVFSSKLLSLGFFRGTPEVPAPHSHHYRAEFDAMARDVMVAFDWSRSPLMPEDEQ
ncbi:hypothetical protein [Dyella flagellata]|uniref:Uncharacterized protein n=1 Tax=Dyella flagellata TaxID=1867833 RepID=A0ABQ5X9G0_9GAMM|nr:hypothetical protein [Dyella flagellata]GLQ88233.1 hypothetical protein GCM10007898_18020 [Dyella flagellata]